MILYLNACVREESRTKTLADHLIRGLEDDVTEVRLRDLDLPRVDGDFLIKRDRLISEGRFDDPMFSLAGQFADADRVVIAAPYWDLSFPSCLKRYLEQICVAGITFRYSADGVPVGLCRARWAVYVTTAGGGYCPDDYGADYVRALFTGFFGIPRFESVKAAGLDIVGADVGGILRGSIDRIERLLPSLRGF